MKKIEAIIKPHRLDMVKAALGRLGIQGMTISEVQGFGRQKGHPEHWRGTEYRLDFLPKLKIEVVVPEPAAADATDAIIRAARTGQIGDGKVFITDLADVVRVRTGERGQAGI